MQVDRSCLAIGGGGWRLHSLKKRTTSFYFFIKRNVFNVKDNWPLHFLSDPYVLLLRIKICTWPNLDSHLFNFVKDTLTVKKINAACFCNEIYTKLTLLYVIVLISFSRWNGWQVDVLALFSFPSSKSGRGNTRSGTPRHWSLFGWVINPLYLFVWFNFFFSQSS